MVDNIEIREHPKFKGIYTSGHNARTRLYTKNLVPGKSVYGERLIFHGGIELREWDPRRSKLAAMVIQRPIMNYLEDKAACLYLGAASGTTISHLSDIMQIGVIYGVEFAERSIRQLIQNTSERSNIIPILGDANYPSEYANSIFTRIDLLYQDVAQPNQAEIAIENSNYYLAENGIGILAIKSQSIDSVVPPEQIYEQEKKKIENAGYHLLETIDIHKYASNHVIIVFKKNF